MYVVSLLTFPSSPSVHCSVCTIAKKHTGQRSARVMRWGEKSKKDKLATMKRELLAEREESDEKLMKLKLEKAPAFKKKGHEKQSPGSTTRRSSSSFDVRSACGTFGLENVTPAAVEKAKTIVDEGEKLVAEGQKHIRISDRSENGWATVEEY